MCDNAERTLQLVDYLYGELGAGERQAFEAHLDTCGTCRAEVAGLEVTRERMAAWTPPEPDLGLRLVRGDRPAAVVTPPRRSLAPWGLAAAATLVLAASAAVANLEVRFGSDGLVVRTGWAHAGATDGATVRQVGADEATELEQWKSELARVQARLNELEDGLASRGAAEFQAASTGSGISEADMIRRVREIVSQSETRQQREITARVSQIIEVFDRQRRNDMALIQQGMGQYHGLTNAEIAQQRDMLHQLVRVATRQER